jgi:hypothetical protein
MMSWMIVRIRMIAGESSKDPSPASYFASQIE